MDDAVALTWVSARPDGDLVAVGDIQGRVRVWSPRENRVVARQELGSRVRRVEWTRDGSLLLAIAEGDELFVYSADGSRLEATIATGHGSVRGLSVHPTKLWAATSGDPVVRVWDLAARSVVHELPTNSNANGTVTAMAEAYVVAGLSSGNFIAWSLETGQELADGPLFGSYVGALAIRGDGQSMVAGGGRGGLVEIKPDPWRTGAVWGKIPPKPIATNAIVFDAKGSFLCAHSDDTCSLFASAHTPLPSDLGSAFWIGRKTPWTQDFIVSAACFLPGTKLMLSTHFTGQLRVWELDIVAWKRATVVFDANDAIKVEGKLPGLAREGVEKTCASCGKTAFFAHAPTVGEPREDAIEECLECGHIAPKIDFAYPQLEISKKHRDAIAGAATVTRLLYVAALFGDADPRARAEWLMRAAKSDDDSQQVRGMAAAWFEKALARGYALGKRAGQSSLLLSALYRASGDFERATEHCRRGLMAHTAQEEKLALIAEAQAVLAKRPEVVTSEAVTALPAPERLAILRDMERACPSPPPLALALGPDGARLEEEAIVFARDFLAPEHIPDVLRAKRPGVWEAVVARPALLPALLRATDHPERAVQVAAVDALYNKTLTRSMLEPDVEAIAALRQRITDKDERVANKARAVHEQIVHIFPAFAARSGAVAKAGAVTIIGGPEQRARTLAEMRFAASLRKCTRCGAPAGRLELFGSGDRFTLAGRCEWCATPQTFMFFTLTDPSTAADSPWGSNIVSADAFRAELERLEPRLTEDTPQRESLRERADYCRAELAKFG